MTAWLSAWVSYLRWLSGMLDGFWDQVDAGMRLFAESDDEE